MSTKSAANNTEPRGWQVVVLGALAGGMGWGIRGQYGHETGAMIAGLLLSSVLILVLAPGMAVRPALRAAAWGTIAFGFGGSMTYGQTVGLTHDPALVGNWGAFRWGLLGLAIKGGLWIGFGAAFLGMGLGGKRYGAREIALLLLAMLGLCWLGLHALNRPFDPAQRVLPRFYFSADWRWLPEAALKPRPEVWGAYLFAFVGLVAYVGWHRRDTLGRNLALWGFLGGAVGFPTGQCVQAFHAWNRPLFQSGLGAAIDPVMNWWNWMETTFGTIMGATVALGLWLNRQRIGAGEGGPVTAESAVPEPPSRWMEAGVLGLHVGLLVAVEFFTNRWIDRLYDFGLMLGFLPMVLVAAGRWSPLAFLLPITAIPIAGKTIGELVYEQHALPAWAGWPVYVVLPVGGAVALAAWLRRRARPGRRAAEVLSPVLLFGTLLYWSLNFGFFRFPWPWATWTARTPNGLWFTGCAVVLVATAWARGRREAGFSSGRATKTGA